MTHLWHVVKRKAWLQINPADIPWYPLSFHTKISRGEHIAACLDQRRGIKAKTPDFLQIPPPFFKGEFFTPGTGLRGRTLVCPHVSCELTEALSTLIMANFNYQNLKKICEFKCLGWDALILFFN